jgi:hypothetical protein
MVELRRRFPKIKWWLNWWQRPTIATMIFPACSIMDPKVATEIPRTTNPVEHQHSLLHYATGTQHDLLTGIKKIYGHVHELELQYNAITGMFLLFIILQALGSNISNIQPDIIFRRLPGIVHLQRFQRLGNPRMDEHLIQRLYRMH